MKIFNWFKKKKSTDMTEELKLHLAGATVRHKGKFDSLISYSNDKEITQEFIDKWTAPFYFNLHKTDGEWINLIIGLKSEITDDIILTNLGDFNWRTRQTGAFFAAIMDKKEFTEIIGTHLIKSEVCYAGSEYAKVLASFNTEESISYLEQYLDYYLLQKDLYFDQRQVMEALKFTDLVNNTNRIDRHLDNWRGFIYDRRKSELKSIEKIKKENGDPKMIEHLEKNSAWLEELDTVWIKERIDTIERIKAANNV
ncbi:MAG: hypothetical protein CL843_06725 [Crocinitomicaceae bacterium]|nr:hypothetical protein [Crocinitomicaceae bacterium]